MAKDYAKYVVSGMNKTFNKSRLVQAIVKDYVAKNNPDWESLQASFPDSIQGGKGVVAKKDAGVKDRDFYLNTPITLTDGIEIVTCRQWGVNNIADFLLLAEKLGYSITANSNSSKADSNKLEFFSLSNEVYSEDIYEYVKNSLESCDERGCRAIRRSLMDFVNANHSAYWIIPNLKQHLVYLQGESDDEEKGWDGLIEEIRVHGRELDFNPKKVYSLFYDSFDECLKLDEDADEESEFFDIVTNYFLENNPFQDLDSLTSEELYILHNTCVTTLYCTICKMCEEDISQDELVDLMLSVIDSKFVVKHQAGDFVWTVMEEALSALGVDIEMYEDEEDLWRDLYKYNFDGIADYIIDNDVFDDDYIKN